MMVRRRPPEPVARVGSTRLVRARAAIRQKLDAGQEIMEADFDDSFWDTSVRDQFAETHGGPLATCAWCQLRVFAGGYGVIDHFAPRTEVCRRLVRPGEEPYGSLPNVQARGLGPAHKPAYAWRAYDWDNFVLSCPHCNTGWKRTLFPAISGGELVDGAAVEGRAEEPLLIDPYDATDDPSDHLVFTEDGGVGHRDERGRWTIEALGLDRRATLHLARLGVIDRVKKLATAFELEEIVWLGDPNAELSAVVRDVAEAALASAWDEIVQAAGAK